MIKRLSIPIVMLFCSFFGQVQAAETPPIVETFACSLADGKSMKDVNAATSYWRDQVAKLDDPAMNQYSAWMVTPIRSSLPADFYWLGASPNLNVWAKGGVAYNTSDEGQAAQAKMQKLGSCTSNVWVSEQLHGGAPPEDGDANAILEVFGCQLREGKTMANVRAVEANFVKEAKSAGLMMNIFRFSPMYTDGQTDLLYFVGHDDMESYGATATKQMTTPGTAVANAYFGLVMNCGAGLYNVNTIKAVSPAS